MAQQLKPKSIRNLGIYGVIRQAEVDDDLIPDGAVVGVKNFHFNRKGVSTVRPGLTGIIATVIDRRPMPAVGLHNTLSNTGIIVFDEAGASAIYNFTSGAAVVSLSGGTASVNIRFVDFGSFTIALNFSYNTYTSMRVWAGGADGASYWHTSGHSINPHTIWPHSPQFGEVYKSRVYLFGDTTKEGDPSRLFFSTVIDSQGSIKFDPTVNFVDINPGDGEDGTGLKRYALELLMFKPNYIYRFRDRNLDPDPLIKIGTRSQESIVEGKRGLYFHHDSGFYRYAGGYPDEISRPINDFVEAIPFSQYKNIVGWKDNDHIYWSIGGVTIQETKEKVAWKNVVVCYTESSDVWTIYSYAHEIRRGMTYNSGSASTIVIGTDHGVVAAFNTGSSDFGEPINYWLRTKWYDFGGISSRKEVQEIVGISEKAQGMKLMYQVDEDTTRWSTLGEMTELRNLFKDDIRFYRIRFQVTGSIRKEAPIFRGIEIIRGLLAGLTAE